MKKTDIFLIAAIITLSLTSCGIVRSEPSMVIAPSEFSEETLSVLEIIDDELVFFDYTVDETVKSSSIDVWIYENGEWVSSGSTKGNIESCKQQTALRITNDSCDIFNIQENGNTKSSFKSPADLSTATLIGSTKLTNPTDIQLNKEIPLWVKVGTNGDSLKTMDDFRTSDCDCGIAVTITFSDQELE